MKNPTYKRFFAYIVDFVIVLLIASMFSEIDFINPYLEEYENTTNQYYELLKSEVIDVNSTNETIVNSDLDNNLNVLAYNLSYYGYYILVITLVVKVLYYVVFAYYNDGKTIGKALFKIKVKKTTNNKLKMTDLLVRSAVGYEMIFELINIILLKLCTMNTYLSTNKIVNSLDSAVMMVIVVMILFRKDNRGLHDIISGTKVVNINEGDKNENRNS
jgi:uncharacterized RDD family membrane protein YckC